MKLIQVSCVGPNQSQFWYRCNQMIDCANRLMNFIRTLVFPTNVHTYFFALYIFTVTTILLYWELNQKYYINIFKKRCYRLIAQFLALVRKCICRLPKMYIGHQLLFAESSLNRSGHIITRFTLYI